MRKYIYVFDILVLALLFSSCSSPTNSVTVSDIDLSSIPDGTYKGSYRWGKTDLSVYYVYTTVKDHKIKNIELKYNEKMETKFTRMAKKVIASMLEKQTPKVDAVTGATLSSKQYMKAVENSLLKPEQ